MRETEIESKTRAKKALLMGGKAKGKAPQKEGFLIPSNSARELGEKIFFPKYTPPGEYFSAISTVLGHFGQNLSGNRPQRGIILLLAVASFWVRAADVTGPLRQGG